MPQFSYQLYVGCKPNDSRELFRSPDVPTEDSHGHLYAAVIGPFHTRRAAKLMATVGGNNPHMQTVADAERIARMEVSQNDAH